MKKFLLNNSKWIYYILGIISGLIVLSSLFFMVQYKFVRVNFTLNENNERVYEENSKLNGANQQPLFMFVNNLSTVLSNGSFAETTTEIEKNEFFTLVLTKEDGEYKYLEAKKSGQVTRYEFSQDTFKKLDAFRTELDSYNNLILWYGIISLIVFACLLILSNHNRRIYYKANLYGGIALPAVNIVFGIVLIAKAVSLMGQLNDPLIKAVANIVSVFQDPKNSELAVRAGSDATNLNQIKEIISKFNINSLSLVLFMVFFGIVIAYNVFLMIYAVMKYNATASDRKRVLDNARLAGEKA